jgi:hypothetical protein
VRRYHGNAHIRHYRLFDGFVAAEFESLSGQIFASGKQFVSDAACARTGFSEQEGVVFQRRQRQPGLTRKSVFRLGYDDLRVLADEFLLDLEVIGGKACNGEVDFHALQFLQRSFAVADLQLYPAVRGHFQAFGQYQGSEIARGNVNSDSEHSVIYTF